MPAKQQRLWRAAIDAEVARLLEEPVHRRTIEFACAPETIRLGHPRQQLEIDFLREPAERAVRKLVPDFVEHSGFQMMSRQPEHLRTYVLAVDGMNVQAIEKRRRR